MKLLSKKIALIGLSSVVFSSCLWAATTPEKKATPFQNNNGQTPPKSVYAGPLFTISKDWPQKPLPPGDAPWRRAIHGQQITPQNAYAYTEALKAYVSANARRLILNYATWDATKAGWLNEPWLGSKREAIHGTYPAGEFGPSIFPETGLRANFATHVLTYYDARAAYTTFKLWGATAMMPDVQTKNSQFEEGSVVVKAAVFASEDPKMPLNWWDAMQGAAVWPLYIGTGADSANPLPPSPKVVPGYVAQFDIIVKDSKSSPKTGWVFTTLVYDKDAPGNDAWDKMVPLGAMWGNDPDVTVPGQPLHENWINPKAPKYSTQTLGWGGRLSGPNDGATNNIAVNGKPLTNAPDSSCMSCHSPAEWNVKQHKMDSFILPSFQAPNQKPPLPPFLTCGDHGKPDPTGNGPYICSPAPASADWMTWFQSRPGTEPKDKTSVALDYDDVFAFKALPLWWAAVAPPGQPLPYLLVRPSHIRYNQYTGAPLKAPQP